FDEFTSYLTPGHSAEMTASWKGECVGTGLDVGVEDGRLVVAQVLPDSPAHGQNVKAGDRVIRIAGRAAAGLTADAARELLKGNLNTNIEVDLLGAGEKRPRTVRLKRQVISLPSVSELRFLDPNLGIGYL